ncbi:MAG: RNA polymerase subunit sigma-70 [Halobacteriovoraceae bacterium]|nr:RNA polymerase subunit sigma-70 [Halobacteriovoraceae bacterium]MBC98409.1 RNA polymerase subunit sigma-70 [Halobacteriovoraceae bacterium]|tara:strand:+ start:68696 stop:69715 length:1020 start_codon:yes stop_codon:yes gene_type:complete
MADDKTKIIKNVEVLDVPSSKDEAKAKKSSDYTDLDIENPELAAEDLLPALYISGDLIPTDKVSDDPLTRYLNQIKHYPLLTEDQEKALTKALAETGSVDAAKKLVMGNLRLVVKIAMEYKTAWQNTMDLIQEGNIGLMKAVSKYDAEKGAKLSYYASWWIRSYILKFILDNFRLVKIGTTNEQKKLFFNLMKEKARLESQGIKPDAKTLSDNLGVSEKAVITMDQRLDPNSGGEVSIDTPVGDGEKGTFAQFLEDDAMGPEELVSDQQSMDILQEHLREFVKDLKERDRDIFKKRLLSEVPPSLQSIADEYGVSRERIRQIEERLMNQLKVYMGDHLR